MQLELQNGGRIGANTAADKAARSTTVNLVGRPWHTYKRSVTNRSNENSSLCGKHVRKAAVASMQDGVVCRGKGEGVARAGTQATSLPVQPAPGHDMLTSLNQPF